MLSVIIFSIERILYFIRYRGMRRGCCNAVCRTVRCSLPLPSKNQYRSPIPSFLGLPDNLPFADPTSISISPLTHHPHKPPHRRSPRPIQGEELKKPMKIVDKDRCGQIAENCRQISAGEIEPPSSPLRSSAEIAETYDRTLTEQTRGAAKIARNIEALFK